MAALNLTMDSFWVEKSKYDDAERKFYEQHGNELLTPLAAEVAKARQRIIELKREADDDDGSNKVVKPAVDKSSEHKKNNTNKKVASGQNTKEKADKEYVKEGSSEKLDTIAESAKNLKSELPQDKPVELACVDHTVIKFFEKKLIDLTEVINKLQESLQAMDVRISSIERSCGNAAPKIAVCPAKPVEIKVDDDNDDVDLFGSESEDDETAAKIKEERLAAYNAKKSKKPALIAKSSIILDVKPWDDETDMKIMEEGVRRIECDGLLWGASKLVPLAFGICKLQINCVVEDDKVSIDWLQEQIESNEDVVQSVDIAAFNKI